MAEWKSEGGKDIPINAAAKRIVGLLSPQTREQIKILAAAERKKIVDKVAAKIDVEVKKAQKIIDGLKGKVIEKVTGKKEEKKKEK